ncbi:LysR family transcriptional regulator [Amycolatopsis regifaucium]|uniref:LysR family transcriptional regulator n=1 Tax=Amycolatopsis regifaucium TaxID=546365 RepID=A0A154M5P6_9PSEU|nr:LysR family transcriptional regulator [Amycolatopsis regifaucium]KZB79697.1 LysR family transcriptional regulator [Amycolatopsis regifaucium]OKA09988.1 LysR family transcriptional regulator [Amycolatopsis regifaucium]SFI66096.1 DNA-binding transcriptional regulator, LysR family [Amycolatopsis regifaucium]
MQFHQLAYFVAVADTRHFTRAAERMRVAQPSLSQQIRALERDVGAELFHRIRGNLSLTEAGETLLPYARRILADTESAYQAVRELDELERGRVRLGATPSLCTGLLPSMLAGFRAAYPGIELTLHESGSRDLQTDLSEGALDLALIVDSRLRDQTRLSTRPLLVEELVVISAKDRPAPIRRGRLRILDLKDEPLVMFRRGYDLRDATINACRAEGFEPSFAIQGGEMDAVLEFVQAGMGIAVVPSTVVRDRFRVTRFAEPGLSRVVRLASREDVEPSRAVRALRDAITGYLANAAALPRGTRSLLRPGEPG